MREELKKILDEYSDVDIDSCIDKMFDYCDKNCISDEEALSTVDEYIHKCSKKIKSMQVGSGIANTIGLSKRPNYKVVLYNY